MTQRVSLLGGQGAFSEEAAEHFFKTEWTLLAGKTFQEVAASVSGGAADVAVLPIENSIAGTVEDALEAWRAQRLYAFAEQALPVKQCLLALPGVHLNEVKDVWSHPHALAQCTPFLRQHGMNPMPTSSTVAGAERVSRDQLRHLAALGSARTAERWGLSVLAVDVQAVSANFTRFVALARDPRPRASGSDKTSLAIEPKNGDRGLPKVLEALTSQGVPLLRILSRPVPSRPWQQTFYLDVAGNPAEGALQQASPVLEGLSESLQWLGSYPSVL